MQPVLITSGATRNPVDAIRYLSADSSGGTGAWLASALSDSADVHVMASPLAASRLDPGTSSEVYGSTRDLLARMELWVRNHPSSTVLHACAVGDYEARGQAAKIPSGLDELVLRLTPTPKIVDRIKVWSPDVRLVSFKAASPETTPEALVALARAQLERTRSDLVFANVIGQLTTSATLVGATRVERFEDRQAALAALVHWVLSRRE